MGSGRGCWWSLLIQGKIAIGKSTQTATTYFSDTNKVLIFKNAKFSSSFYSIGIVGASSYATVAYFGTTSGDSGLSGCVFRLASLTQTPIFTFTATDTYITNFGLYGCSFLGAGAISFPEYNTNKKVLNSTFEACAEIVPSTCTVTNCNFVSAAAHAMQMSSTSHQVTSSNFIGCSRGVHLDTAGTYTFNALKFTSNTYDITNSTASALIVNATNLANPSSVENTGGGSVTINNAVTLEVNGVKTGSEPTNYVRCRIEKVSDGAALMNEEAQTSYGSAGYYKATESYNYAGDLDVRIIARYKGYLPFTTTGTITSAGLTVTAVWIADPNYT